MLVGTRVRIPVHGRATSQVHIAETKSSFLHFVTSVCAIVGGVFTVSGIVDACVYRGQQLIRKKMELGQLS